MWGKSFLPEGGETFAAGCTLSKSCLLAVFCTGFRADLFDWAGAGVMLGKTPTMENL